MTHDTNHHPADPLATILTGPTLSDGKLPARAPVGHVTTCFFLAEETSRLLADMEQERRLRRAAEARARRAELRANYYLGAFLTVCAALIWLLTRGGI
jgi:hypothetical protein